VNSYDIRFWQIETRKGKTVTYRVRWVVAGRQFSDSFTTKELAESHRAKLRAAARRGEGFDTETGLPESMVRTLRDVSFYEHCAEFAAATWPVSSAKTRLSVIETLDQGRARRGQRPEGRPRPGGAALGTAQDAEPGRPRGRARRGRGQGHRLDNAGITPGGLAGGPGRGL
jgi:hypothetical protein